MLTEREIEIDKDARHAVLIFEDPDQWLQHMFSNGTTPADEYTKQERAKARFLFRYHKNYMGEQK